MYAHSRHPPGLPASQKAEGWQTQPFLLRVTPAQSARHLTGEQQLASNMSKYLRWGVLGYSQIFNTVTESFSFQ